MYCPFCRSPDTKVTDSRTAHDQVRRRRECLHCGERFTTYETAALSLPRLIKSDGRREAFDEQKLRAGILRALEKRPVDSNAVESLIHHIRHQLLVAGEREMATRQVGEWVMAALRQLDEVAYIRFASVYRSFQDVQAFRDEVERLEQSQSPKIP